MPRERAVVVEPQHTIIEFNIRRLLAAALVVVLLLPAVTSGLSHDEELSTTPEPTTQNDSLVVVATQGDDVGNGDDSRVLVTDPQSQQTLWQTTRYPTYFDVDPLNESTLLYAAQRPNGESVAVVHNWRTDTVYDRFAIANGTHDVDALGNDRYVYADGVSHRVVVVDVGEDRETIWTYDFTEQFPPSAGGGDANSYAGDYTHLNDVDPVGDDAFLVSPRNFDRVFLIDRTNRTVRWSLGSEDDYDTLYEQHNPTLLSQSPPTVLVADSENNRVVEYRRTDGEWRQVWAYADDLEWPRDADRLPNGDTLLLDSRSVRRVTPSREIVWELHVPKFPYDVERIDLGDEPSGPSMAQPRFADQFDDPTAPGDDRGLLAAAATPVTEAYATAGWVLPFWVTLVDFIAVIGASGVVVVWAGFELARLDTGLQLPTPSTDRAGSALTAGLLLAGGFTLFQSVAPSLRFADGLSQFQFQWWRWDPFFHVVGTLGVVEALVRTERRGGIDRFGAWLAHLRSGGAAVVVLTGVGVLAVSLGVGTDGIIVSNPGRLQVAAVGGVLLGGRRLSVATGDRQSLFSATTVPVPVVSGLIGVLAGLWALGNGATAVSRVPGYFAVGLSLALVGRNHLRRAVADDTAAGAVRGVWYLVRVPVGLGAAATLARTIGVGSIEGVSLSPSVVTPLLVTGFLLVVSVWGASR
jgi:hypothetical protein